MKTLALSFIFLLRTIISSGQIIFESTDISFDTIYLGQSISKTLYFKNTSVNSVIVNGVKSSSSGFFCRFGPRVLLPNQQDSIGIVVQTYSFANAEGLQNITVTINFDNGTSQLINLKGFIKPALLNFYRIGEARLKLIKNKQDYQFAITNFGDSVIYIDQIFVFDTLYINASVDKKILLKNDTATITAVIKKEFVQEEFLQSIPKIDLNSEETQEGTGLQLQIQVKLKDCCGLTQDILHFDIEYFEYE